MPHLGGEALRQGELVDVPAASSGGSIRGAIVRRGRWLVRLDLMSSEATFGDVDVELRDGVALRRPAGLVAGA